MMSEVECHLLSVYCLSSIKKRIKKEKEKKEKNHNAGTQILPVGLEFEG